MASKLPAPNDAVEMFRRIVQPQNGRLTKAVARLLLAWTFGEEDRNRMNELAQKNQQGDLTAEEHAEMHCYLRVGAFLDLIHSKARLCLIRQTTRSSR